jgi:hypothetical protein
MGRTAKERGSTCLRLLHPLFVALLVVIFAAGCTESAPLSIEAMQAKKFAAHLGFERALEEGPSFSSVEKSETSRCPVMSDSSAL